MPSACTPIDCDLHIYDHAGKLINKPNTANKKNYVFIQTSTNLQKSAPTLATHKNITSLMQFLLNERSVKRWL